ncbi:MAG: IS1595 family transposase [Gammaproteobacteria bacterium]|nr:MAG: IS1595 family transposase [Gammaproteobacteria bacterium]
MPKMPVSGRDYPRTWDQFLDWFPDEAACRRYLEGIRWRGGFVCPSCGEPGEAFRGSRGRWICRHCRYQCTVTAGTVFDKTRTSLRSWMAAVWYITNQKQGVTALGLQRVLGLGSYQTAWAMLHRLRRAMIRPGRERLSGVVEVDESVIGRSPPNRTSDTEQKQRLVEKVKALQSIVVIAVEVKEPKGFGRIRLRRVSDTSAASVLPFVKDSIEPGSLVRTDGSWAYHKLTKHGYRRDRNVMLDSDDPAHVSMPAVHRVAALLKRWLLGTHQGAVKPKHLDYYLDEFTFRFNRRTSRSRGLLFYRMIEQAVVTEPVTYAQIAGKVKHQI